LLLQFGDSFFFAVLCLQTDLFKWRIEKLTSKKDLFEKRHGSDVIK